ncbi:MAG: glycosyltransferase [Geminicoccaceae bacterium]|nr:glycosyltransferase [Geminicoccaceae bacterium]
MQASDTPQPLDPGVSVLIPTFQAGHYLQGCLEAIWAQSYAGPLEVVVADGGSTDRTREIARRAGQHDRRVRLIDNPDRVQAAGLNRAARAAIYPLLIRCDAQSRLPPHAVELMVIEHGLARGLNVGGTQTAVSPGTSVGQAVAAVYNTWIGSGGAAYRIGRAPADVDTVYLGSWRRDELLAVGGWSTAVGCTEDAELNLRWRRLGGRVRLLPQIPVDYLPRTSLLSLFRQYARYGYWRTRTAALHRGLAVRQALALTPLATALLALLASAAPVLALPAILYGLAVAGQSLRRRACGVRWLVPLVLTTMHLAWGAGFVAGMLTLPFRRPLPKADVTMSLG